MGLEEKMANLRKLKVSDSCSDQEAEYSEKKIVTCSLCRFTNAAYMCSSLV